MKSKTIICFVFIIFKITGSCNNENPTIVSGTVPADTIKYAKSSQILGNTRSFGVAISDIDNDNDNDIFISNYIGPSQLWINDGSGFFSQSSQVFRFSPTVLDGAHDVAIADLNGDTFPDIFIVNHDIESKVFLNDGSGQFNDSGQNIGSATDFPQTIQLCDVDGDSDKDALIYNFDAPNSIWLNDGQGNFMMTSIDYGGSDCNGLKLADFNGDNFPDLYIRLRNSPNQVWMNDGTGNFVNSGQTLGGDMETTECADIDGDDDIDIIDAGFDEIKFWLNQDNSGTFIEGSNIGEGALELKLFDADLDGDNDLITAHINNGNKLWKNDGSGLFESLGTLFGTTRVLSIDCGKLNADNSFDVLLGKLESVGGNEIYFNND